MTSRQAAAVPTPTPYTPWYLYKRLLEYIKPYKFRALVAVFITIPIGLLDGMIAFSLKPYVDVMQAKSHSFNLSFIPLIIVLFTLLQGGLNYVSTYCNGWLGMKVLSDIRRDLFTKLLTLDVSYFEGTTTGLVLQQFFRNPESIQNNVLNNIKQMVSRVSSSVGLIVVLFTLSWQLSIIAVASILLVLYPSTLIRKRLKRIFHATNVAAADIMMFYTDTASGIKTIYGFNFESAWLEHFNLCQNHLLSRGIKAVQAQGWLSPSMHTISSLGIALLIWQGSSMVMANQLTVGSFVSFITAMLLLYNPIKNLGGTLVSAQMSLIALEQVVQLLDMPSGIQSSGGTQLFKTVCHSIRFEEVEFRYPTSSAPVLKKLNLDIEKNKITALVGHSGGGKSTIANLIPRFYEIEQGKITIDGIDIRDLDLQNLRHRIALVTQDTFVFTGTLYHNLLVASPHASRKQIDEALEKAYLLDFVQSLPQGLDHQIGERGVLLSGGQRQRLAIARAFLKDAPILILDEATSALDNKSEAIVHQAMESILVNRTAVIIAHRLSTIKKADKIVVIQAGEVVESGTHETLLSHNAFYAELYHSQFRKQEREQLGLVQAVFA